jgi:hypothetical protein
MKAVRAIDGDQERVRRILYRQRVLPDQLARARARVRQLEAEAAMIGMQSLVALEDAHLSGDMIATEYLKRLGYFRGDA